MQQPDFRFQIIAFKNRYTLQHAPIGWEDMEFNGEKVELYKVIRRSFSVNNLKFVADGADILAAVFFSEGIDGNAQLIVDEFNTDTYLYENIVTNDFDFSLFDKNEAENQVSIKTIDRGVSANLIAHDTTVYEVPLDNNEEAITVNIGSLAVDENADWVTVEQNAFALNNIVQPSIILQHDTTSDELAVPNSVSYYAGPTTIGIASFVSFGANLTVNLTGSASVRLGINQNWPPNTIGRLFVFLKDINSGTVYLLKTLYYDQTKGRFQTFYFDINKTVSVTNTTQFAYYYAYGQPIGDSPDSAPGFFIDVKSLNLRIQYNAYEDDYLCKALRPMTLLRSLIQQINPGIDVETTSNILSRPPWNRLCVTSGDSLRAIPGAVIKTKLEDYFVSYDSQLNLGLDAYDNKIVVEKYSFFRNQFKRKLQLGEVKNLVFDPDLTYAYSSISVGYDNQEYRTLNGRDEQNTLESWSTSNNRVQTVKTIKSVYRADSRGIDQLIIDNRQNQTSDTKSDNEIFFLYVKENPEEDGTYKPEGVEIYANVEGLASVDRSYNTILSPRHMLQRHGDELSIPMALSQKGTLKFQSSAKNANMVLTNFDGTKFIEKADINYADISNPISLPVVATFETSITNKKFKDFLEDKTNYGYIEFQYKGKIYQGFPDKDSFVVDKNISKQIKVAMSPRSLAVLQEVNSRVPRV